MVLLCLMLALVAYLFHLVGQWAVVRKWQKLQLFARPHWLWGGLMAHTGGLVWQLIAEGTQPLAAMDAGLDTIAFMVALLAVGLARRVRMDAVSTLLVALVVLLLASARLVPTGTAEGHGLMFTVHVGMILVGFASFLASFSLAGFFLLVRHRLKQKDLANIGRLPALQTLDDLHTRAMGLGFLALTAGMAVGGLWSLGVGVDAGTSSDFGLDLTVIATLLVWLWYAVGLYLRLVVGWQGRLAALFSVGGFAGIFSLVGVAALVSGAWHGWGG